MAWAPTCPKGSSTIALAVLAEPLDADDALATAVLVAARPVPITPILGRCLDAADELSLGQPVLATTKTRVDDGVAWWLPNGPPIASDDDATGIAYHDIAAVSTAETKSGKWEW